MAERSRSEEERSVALRKRSAMLPQRSVVLPQRSAVLLERSVVLPERSAALCERSIALLRRSATLRKPSVVVLERPTALPERSFLGKEDVVVFLASAARFSSLSADSDFDSALNLERSPGVVSSAATQSAPSRPVCAANARMGPRCIGARGESNASW